MPTAEALPFASIFHEAEHELAAFLSAVNDLVGLGGLSQAGDLWIKTMKDDGCPGTDPKRFFRRVTVRAAAELAESSASWIQPQVEAPGVRLQIYA